MNELDHGNPGAGARRRLAEGLAALDLPAERLEPALWSFVTLLGEWSLAYNLTAVRDPEEMVTRHVLDSLAIREHVPPGCIADLGTGAGLPGIPLALALPDRDFVLVDSVAKKLRFVRHTCRQLGIANVTAVNARIEDYRRETPFDAVVARALTQTGRLAALSAPLLRPGGVLLAMAGRDPGTLEAPPGFDTPRVRKVKVPSLSAERHLIVMRRTG